MSRSKASKDLAVVVDEMLEIEKESITLAKPAMSTRKLVASTVGAQLVRMALMVISGPILSRLVGPAAYGILAPAQSVGAMGQLVAESGFAYHTVTAKELSADQAKDLHWQSMRLAGSIAVIAGIIAACIGHVPLWQHIFRGAFALIGVVVAGSTAVPYAYSQRIGSMSKLEWSAVISQAVTTFCIAIPCAFLGAKIGAATANLYVPSLAGALIAWHISGLARLKGVPTFIERSYRAGTLSANVATYLAGNVDTLILATYLAVDPLGVYSRASLLASLPGNAVAAAVARVGLVSLSKSDKWEDHRRFLIKASLITFGCFFSLAAVSFLGLDVMRIAFGPKFEVSKLGFGWLTIAQAFFFAGNQLDTYLTVRRRMGTIASSHFFQTFISAVLFFIYRPTTLLSIGLVLLASALPRYFLVLVIILRRAVLDARTQTDLSESL